MGRLVSIDGQIVAADEARVSVFDRGFLYGDSVFETIRTYDGQPFELEAHLSRLARSAELVAIELPVSLTQLGQEIISVVGQAGNSESYIRLMITRGAGELGLAPELSLAPLRVVLVMPLTPPPEKNYREGIDVISVQTQRATDASDTAGAKVGNYLASVLAMKQAALAGAKEALILDQAGRVVEGASSNIFLVKQGRLVTPPESAGILPGITRANLLLVAAREHISVEFKEIELRDVLSADEVFISSSIREILPVVRVDGQLIGRGEPGRMTQRLLASFRAWVRGHGSVAR